MNRHFDFDVLGSERSTLRIRPELLVVVGYTGRDEKAVLAHIEELAAIGIPPPPRVPMLYDLDPGLLTIETDVRIGANLTTGEVEPVFIKTGSRWFLGIGSDLTDRELERRDVRDSKAACPKPIGRTVIELPDNVASGGFDEYWDQVHATSHVDGTLYQEGFLKSLRAPSDLIPRISEAFESDHRTDADAMIFAGTLPLLDGSFRSGASWKAQLTLPDDRILTHAHAIGTT